MVDAPERAYAARRPALWLFGTALILRLLAVFLLNSPAAAPTSNGDATTWDWGWEAACTAESLYEGRGWADPFGQGTGASSRFRSARRT